VHADTSTKSGGGLTGTLRLTLMIVTLMVALLGIGVVFDVISLNAFGHYLKTTLLVAIIVALAAGCLALLSRARI